MTAPKPKPAPGDPVAYLSGKGVHGGIMRFRGVLINATPHLAVVWGEREYHGGLDIVRADHVFLDPADAEAAKDAHDRLYHPDRF